MYYITNNTILYMYYIVYILMYNSKINTITHLYSILEKCIGVHIWKNISTNIFLKILVGIWFWKYLDSKYLNQNILKILWK